MAVYYSRIKSVLVLDQKDYFLISAIIGSIVASHLKNYLSEKKAMKRLEKSIINKSKLTTKANTPILNSKQAKIRKIYNLALDNRGGQLEEFQPDFSNETYKFALVIKGLVERLAAFLKERELKGVARIFFKGGRLVLQFVLLKCNVDITYVTLNEGISTQTIIITATLGGAAGFTVAWFSVGAALVTPPVLISTLLLRSVTQQIFAQIDYLNFKKMVEKFSDNEKIKETVRVVFVEGEGPPIYTGKLIIKPQDFNKNSALNHDFNLKSSGDLEEFLIKSKMEKELGLIENPTETQLKEIIHRRLKRKPKGKTVLFGDFIDLTPHEGDDLLDSDIINAKPLEKLIRIDLDNEL